MQKLLFSFCIVLLLFSNLNANDTKEMTDEEFMAEFMQLVEEEKEAEREIVEAKAKTEAVMQLGRTVDKLAEKLGIDD